MGTMSSRPGLVAATDASIPAYLFWDDGIHLRSFAPVVHGRKLVGTLVLEERLPAIAEQLMESDGLVATGYAAMCVGGGSTDMLCYPDGHTPGTYRAPVFSKNGDRTPMSLAVHGRSGVFKGLDYRNRNVIAAHAPLSSRRSHRL